MPTQQLFSLPIFIYQYPIVTPKPVIDNKNASETSNPEVEEMFSCKISEISSKHPTRTLTPDKKRVKKSEQSSNPNWTYAKKPSSKTDVRGKYSKSESRTKDKNKSDDKRKDSRSETDVCSKSRKQKSDQNPESAVKSRHDSKAVKKDCATRKTSESENQKTSKSEFHKNRNEKSSKDRHQSGHRDKSQKSYETAKDKAESSSKPKELVSEAKSDVPFTDLTKKTISGATKSENPVKSKDREKSSEKDVSSVTKITCADLPVKPKKLSFEAEILKADLVQLKKPNSPSSSKQRISEKVISKLSISSSKEVTPSKSNKIFPPATKESKSVEDTQSLNAIASLRDSVSTWTKETPERDIQINPGESVSNNTQVTRSNEDEIVNATKSTSTKESGLSLNKSDEASDPVVQEDVREGSAQAEDEALVYIKLELMQEPNKEATQPGKTAVLSMLY